MGGAGWPTRDRRKERGKGGRRGGEEGIRKERRKERRKGGRRVRDEEGCMVSWEEGLGSVVCLSGS